MQISILSNNLLSVLKKLEPLTKTKHVEILRYIHISAWESVHICATNLELYASYMTTAKVHVPGTVAADPSSLIKFLETLDKKQNFRVDLELIKGTPATYESKPCPRCEGAGEVQCETCHGTGQRRRVYGPGEYDCDQCNHTGKRPCSFVSNYSSETCVKGQTKKQIDPGVPDKLIVSCGTKKIEIKVLPAEDYPAVFTAPDVEYLNLPTDALFPELERVKISCATENNRPILTGMLWETEWNAEVSDTATLFLAGADGYRLHIARVGIIPQYKLSAIVPGDTISYLLKHCKDPHEISICINPTDPHQMFIIWKDSMLVTQLIDGRFPDVRSIVPKTHDTYFLANSADVLDALKTASIYSNKGNGTIDIKTVPNGFACQGLAVSATSQGEGKVEQEIPIENCSNNAVNEFAFHQKYMIDAAKILPGKITFYMGSSSSPAMLQGEYDTFQVIIMPMSKSR